MKRLKRIICSVFVMVFAFSATCFAATKTYSQEQLDLVVNDLRAANIEDAYITAIINHISANPLTKDEAKTLKAEIDKFAAKTDGRDKRDDYTLDELTEMYSEAKTIASQFGLRLSMNGKIPSNVNQAAKAEITVYDDGGSSISTTTLKNIKEMKSKVNLENLKTAVKNAVIKDEDSEKPTDPSIDTNKDQTGTGTVDGNPNGSNKNGKGATLIAGNRKPIMSTSMKKTGTNNGNLLLAGSVLIVSALGIAVYSRKKKIA